MNLFQWSTKIEMNKIIHGSLEANYAFTRSETRKNQLGTDGSIGKQLIYVPMHTLNATPQIEWKGYYLRYTQVWASKRFTTRDNSDEVSGYTTGDLFIGKEFTRNGHSINLQFALRNLWNQQYQIVRLRPMPGRAYEGTVCIHF